MTSKMGAKTCDSVPVGVTDDFVVKATIELAVVRMARAGRAAHFRNPQAPRMRLEPADQRGTESVSTDRRQDRKPLEGKIRVDDRESASSDEPAVVGAESHATAKRLSSKVGRGLEKRARGMQLACGLGKRGQLDRVGHHDLLTRRKTDLEPPVRCHLATAWSGLRFSAT